MSENIRCSACGCESFNINMQYGTVNCSNCGRQYSNNRNNASNTSNRNQANTKIDTSSPNDFKIAFGILKKYTGNSKHIVIPEGVTEISAPDHHGVFESDIESIVLPKSLKVIGQNAFGNSIFSGTRIREISIPDGVVEIKRDAFANCSHLSNINIPESVQSIGDSVFSGCSSLLHIEIPGSVQAIGSRAFENCKSLKTVKLNSGLKSIGSRAFSGCTELTSINIPETVTDIYFLQSSRQSAAFYNCYMLTQITYPKRFAPITFVGTAWYDAVGMNLQAKYLIANGICPERDCKGKLSIFKRCKRCGKQY